MNPLIVVALFVAVAIIVFISLRLRAAMKEKDLLRAAKDGLTERFKRVLDADAERARILDELKREREDIRVAGERERAAQRHEIEGLATQRVAASKEIGDLTSRIETLRRDLSSLDEESTLQSFGFYKPRYQFVDSSQYQMELERIREAQKVTLKQKMAATCQIEWTVNGSKVEGRKQTNQSLNLMLRAFNGECDAAVAKVKYSNVSVMEARIRKAYEKVNSLAEVQKCQISQSYLELKLKELFLAHEYQEKLQEERRSASQRPSCRRLLSRAIEMPGGGPDRAAKRFR